MKTGSSQYSKSVIAERGNYTENRASDTVGLLDSADASRVSGHLEGGERPARDRAEIGFLSNPQLDWIVTQVTKTGGRKHPATFGPVHLGGAGSNGARVAMAEGICPAIIGVQGEDVIELVQAKLRDMGVLSYLFGRHDGTGITFGMPNGKPGQFDLYVQRPTPPIRLSELVGAPADLVRNVRAMFMGPVSTPDDETMEVHKHVAELAAYSVLQPHPDLIRSKSFCEIAQNFDFLALNASEARILDPSVEDTDRLALRLRGVIGEDVEFAITNGAARGLMWADGHWWEIAPPKVPTVNDVGAGDAFVVALVIERLFKGQSVPLALARAVETAARWVSGQPLVQLTWSEVAL